MTWRATSASPVVVVKELQLEYDAWCLDRGIEAPDLTIGYVGGSGPDEAGPFYQSSFAAQSKHLRRSFDVPHRSHPTSQGSHTGPRSCRSSNVLLSKRV
jgi:hypothetical protein